MLTIFSCPKPFTDPHINIIQRNAIKSWTLLKPRPEIILIGDEEGTAEICKELGLRHIPEVERNEYGTPLVSSIFEIAQSSAHFSLLCYINTDIILLGDFISAIKRVLKLVPKCLIVGRRWNLDINKEIEFFPEWEFNLKFLVLNKGILATHDAIDYFVFPKGTFNKILPFALGRCVWDEWLIYKAKEEKLPIVDITDETTVIHQNHDYSLNPIRHRSVEYKANWDLIGGYPWEVDSESYRYVYTLSDADYKLSKIGLNQNRSLFILWRKFLILTEIYPFLKPVITIIKRIRFLYRTKILRHRWF